jgi:SAM-dependent methyltransferase
VDLLTRVSETNRCPGGKHTVRRIARRLGVGPQTRVLEIGSNTGFTSLELVKISGCEASGIDVNAAAVAEANRRAAGLANGLGERVQFQVGDACRLPFPDDSFDLIVCGGANSFIQDRARAFAEYARVLRPYGYVSITNLYYRSQPPAPLLAELRDVLGFEISPYGLTDWLTILAPDPWELYTLSTTDLTSRQPAVIDEYVDQMCAESLTDCGRAEAAAITNQWREVMHLFNRNHAYLSYMELTLRLNDIPEQPEVFLPQGGYDTFFERDFISTTN